MDSVLASKQNHFPQRSGRLQQSHYCGRFRGDGPQWNLYCGDAKLVLGNLLADHYTCAMTSPPYYWQRDYNVPGQIGLEPTIEGYVEAISDVMDGVRRVLAPRGVLFLNLGDTYYSGKGRPQGKDRKHNGRRMIPMRVVDASGLALQRGFDFIV